MLSSRCKDLERCFAQELQRFGAPSMLHSEAQLRRFFAVFMKPQEKLLDIHLSRAIFINLSDEGFNVDRHLEVVLDNLNQLVGIDTSFTTFFSSESNERI